MYYNQSQGPYNPAMVKDPSTGEWLLFYTFDEVCFCLRGFPAVSVGALCLLRQSCNVMVLTDGADGTGLVWN